MKLMFIVLESEKLSEEPNHEWINIGYLVSAVKDLSWLEVEVEFFYIDNLEQCTESIQQVVTEKKPDIIGVPVYQYTIDAFLAITRKIKETNSNIFIIAGNTEVSINPSHYMETVKELDAIIVDEGEETLHELVRLRQENGDLSRCKGILFRKGEVIVSTEPRPVIENLDAIRFPSKEFYKQPLTTHFLVCSRGCTGRCTFCAYKKGSVRRRSFPNIFEEIRELQVKYKCKYIHILDGAFGDGEDDIAAYYRNFYEGIMESKLRFSFSFYARSEQINEKSVIELQKLTTVGLDYVMVGIEAGNSEDLKIYGKKATLEDNVKAVRLLNEAGVNSVCGCIMFNPYTTQERLIQNIEFIKKYDIFLNASRLSSRLGVYSGTPIAKKLEKDGLLNQPSNLPILDGYGYQFLDEEMEIIWTLFDHIDQRIREKSHINFHKAIMTSMSILSHVYGIDCAEIRNNLQLYKEYCFSYNYELFYKVLRNYQAPGFYETIVDEVDEHIKRLHEMEQEIEQKKMRSLYKGYRKEGVSLS